VTVTTNNTGGFEVTCKTVLSPEAEAKLVAAMPEGDREAVRLSLAARREQILVKPQPKPSIMRVPQLCVWVDGELEPVNDEHFLTPDSWSLLDSPAELSGAEFSVEEHADMYLIDVIGKRLVERHLGSQAAFGFEDVQTNVTDLALSRQLERALRKQGIRPEVLLEFIRKTIGWLVNSRKLSLPTLLHVRFALEKALREKSLIGRRRMLPATNCGSLVSAPPWRRATSTPLPLTLTITGPRPSIMGRSSSPSTTTASTLSANLTAGRKRSARGQSRCTRR
jgi:type III restriction enzyme